MNKETEYTFLRKKKKDTNGHQEYEKVLNMTISGKYKSKQQYYLAHVKMAIIKNTNDNKCCPGYGEIETFVHCWL